MNEYLIDEFRGKKFTVETSVGTTTARGTATIFNSWQNVCWGELKVGKIIQYHTFFLKLDGTKVKSIEINQHERWPTSPDPRLDRRMGTKEEVQRLYEILVGNRIDKEKLAERQKLQQKENDKFIEKRIKKGLEIKNMRQALKDKLSELSAGLTINEALSNKELLALSTRISLFNLIYPDRKK
jgi:hypothetical protein